MVLWRVIYMCVNMVFNVWHQAISWRFNAALLKHLNEIRVLNAQKRCWCWCCYSRRNCCRRCCRVAVSVLLLLLFAVCSLTDTYARKSQPMDGFFASCMPCNELQLAGTIPKNERKLAQREKSKTRKERQTRHNRREIYQQQTY